MGTLYHDVGLPRLLLVRREGLEQGRRLDRIRLLPLGLQVIVVLAQPQFLLFLSWFSAMESM